MEDYDYLFKIVLLGNAGVGKTCLVRRFTQGLFPPGQGATIGVDFMIKTVEIKGVKVKLQIWDTAGQERFRSITQSYYRSANALILTYDITCEDSFRCLPEWLREIKQYANNQVVTVLVGHLSHLLQMSHLRLEFHASVFVAGDHETAIWAIQLPMRAASKSLYHSDDGDQL
ncbi:ras-related protein Rab-30 isoform X3 [Myxocyprinus asiaticus]|uniref:ras-related protein Rab-30 isoform X3 n=1 Tax=Myxocyprinus asiaticus TaxID=70543 RepID=UPI0022222DF5|nr:ras-related protein Rab-30 isoform X3 [Myxocyprinus asiaticus]